MSRSIHTPDYGRLRSLLIAAREKAGLTQVEVAKRLDRPQSFVSKYESGERHLDVMEFIQVCDAIEANPKAILGQLMLRSVK
jgi:transcriptional regulator with XRE-family HTH domain